MEKWSENSEKLGSWVRATRQQLGLTQGDLGSIVGCSRQTMTQIENGRGRESKFFRAIVVELQRRYLEKYMVRDLEREGGMYNSGL
jgi:transcriptional regulator with XRE-family HTH domain